MEVLKGGRTRYQKPNGEAGEYQGEHIRSWIKRGTRMDQING